MGGRIFECRAGDEVRVRPVIFSCIRVAAD